MLSDDRRTVTLNLRNATGADNLRIVTAAVPEPASFAILAIAGFPLLGRRRRRAAR